MKKLKRKKKKRYAQGMYNRNASSFATSNPEDFPALKALFHGEDVIEGDTSWTAFGKPSLSVAQ